MKYPNQKYRDGMSVFLGVVVMGVWTVGTQVLRRRKRKRDEFFHNEAPPEKSKCSPDNQ